MISRPPCQVLQQVGAPPKLPAVGDLLHDYRVCARLTGMNSPDLGDAPPTSPCRLSRVRSITQTLTMVDVAIRWTECFPLVVREATLVVDRRSSASPSSYG